MQYERELVQGMLPKEDHFDSSSSIDGNMNSLTLQKLTKQGPGQYHYESDDMDKEEGGKEVDEVRRQILMDEKMFEAAREGDLTSVSVCLSLKYTTENSRLLSDCGGEDRRLVRLLDRTWHQRWVGLDGAENV